MVQRFPGQNGSWDSWGQRFAGTKDRWLGVLVRRAECPAFFLFWHTTSAPFACNGIARPSPTALFAIVHG